MNINKIAKAEGLSNLQVLSTFQVNKLCTSVSSKLSKLFFEYDLSEEHLFAVLKSLNMYSAEFKDKNVSAKYHYQTNTIFIDNSLDLCCPDSVLIHECLHFLQSEIEKGKVIQMGLFNVRSYTNKGLALNEASVQTIASQVSNIKPSSLKYFDMHFTTSSPDYYPLETALLKQMSYFTGTYPLIYSTIYSTSLFKDVFSAITSKKQYEEISKKINKLLYLQEKFLKAEEENNDSDKENIKDAFKRDVQWMVSDIQKSIFKNAFTKQFKKIQNMQDIRNFRASLYNFNNYLIEIPEDNSFEQFRDSITSDLISLEIELSQKGYIENTNINKSLSPINNYSFRYFKIFFNKLKINAEILFRIRQKEGDYY